MRRPTGRAEFREPCAAMAMAMAGLLGWVNGFRLHELLFVPAARGKCRLSLVALQDGWESLWVSLLVSSVAGYGLFRDAHAHAGLLGGAVLSVHGRWRVCVFAVTGFKVY
jgi:hypothetical protein